MSRFEKIYAEFRAQSIEFRGAKQDIEFFLRAKNVLLQEQIAQGKSIEEVKENLDFQLCELEIETIKKRESEKEIRNSEWRMRRMQREFNRNTQGFNKIQRYPSMIQEHSSATEEATKETEKKPGSYPLHYRKRIIDAAVRLSEKFDKWTVPDLAEEIGVSKKTFYSYKKFFKFESINDIRDEAKEMIRKSEK
jgi:hypothetical protein